jgi:cell division protein FtsX
MVIGVIIGAILGAVFGYIVGWFIELFPSFNNALVSGLTGLGIPISSMGGMAAFLAAIGFILGILGGVIHMFARRAY